MPKDACYYKVKARYKVFPSAYASGAIAKCRKVGAANYGTGGKKKKTKKKAMGGVVKMSNGGNIKGINMEDIEKKILEINNQLKNTRKRLGMAKFTVDSKGNVKKNFKNGGKVARGCGAVMRRKKTFYA